MAGCWLRYGEDLVEVTEGWLAPELHFAYLSKEGNLVLLDSKDAVRALHHNFRRYSRCSVRRSKYLNKLNSAFNVRRLEHSDCSSSSKSSNSDDGSTDIDEKLRQYLNSHLNKDNNRFPLQATSPSRSIPPQRPNNEAGANADLKFQLDIDHHVIKTIIRWLRQNPWFPEQLGLGSIPDDLMSGDRSYLQAVLFALNPIVDLKKLSERENYDGISVYDIQGRLSKREFAAVLGLKQITHKSNGRLYIKDSQPDVNGNETYKLSPVKNYPLKDSPESRWIKKIPGLEPSNVTKPKSPNTAKNPYTIAEDEAIINWVLKDANNVKVNGNNTWKRLEQDQKADFQERSWQSLRERYIKRILYQLGQYNLSEADRTKLMVGAERGLIKKQKIDKYQSTRNKENSKIKSLKSTFKPKTPLKESKNNHKRKPSTDTSTSGRNSEDSILRTTRSRSKNGVGTSKVKAKNGPRKLFNVKDDYIPSSASSSGMD